LADVSGLISTFAIDAKQIALYVAFRKVRPRIWKLWRKNPQALHCWAGGEYRPE
jgi:hypothetical protein